eukprot:2003907-Alexandrium_andersonii.AAC.1
MLLGPAEGGVKRPHFEDPLTAPWHPDQRIFNVYHKMRDIQVGIPVEPVREFGPSMLATRTENPQGSLKRTIEIQEHPQGDWVDSNDWA